VSIYPRSKGAGTGTLLFLHTRVLGGTPKEHGVCPSARQPCQPHEEFCAITHSWSMVVTSGLAAAILLPPWSSWTFTAPRHPPMPAPPAHSLLKYSILPECSQGRRGSKRKEKHGGPFQREAKCFVCSNLSALSLGQGQKTRGCIFLKAAPAFLSFDEWATPFSFSPHWVPPTIPADTGHSKMTAYWIPALPLTKLCDIGHVS
jgi:hypothetical protein